MKQTSNGWLHPDGLFFSLPHCPYTWTHQETARLKMEMMMNQQIPGCPIFRQSWMSKSNIELGFGWASVLWIQGIAVPLMVSFNTSREHGGKAWHIQHKEPFVESSWNSLICSTCPSRFLWYTHSSLHQIDGPDIHKYLLILIHVDKSQTIYGAYPPVEHNAYIYMQISIL